MSDIVPATNIYLDSDTDFWNSEPEFHSEFEDIFVLAPRHENIKQIITERLGSDKFYQSAVDVPQDKNAVLYLGQTSDRKVFDNPFYLRWNNIGSDKGGNRIDFKLSCSSLKIGFPIYAPGEAPFYHDWTYVLCQSSWGSGPILAQSDRSWELSMEFEVSFYNHETGEEIIDQILLMGVDDLDCQHYSGYESEYAEQFELISGFDSNVYVRNESERILTIEKNNTLFKAKAGNDNNDYTCGLVCGIRSGAHIRWSAMGNAGTFLFNTFESHEITATKQGEGSITYEGKKSIGWRNDRTYTATADKYCDIVSMTVDGKSIPITDTSEQSYSFTDVREEHTIHVVFEHRKHSVIYEPGYNTYTGETPSQTQYAGTNVEVSQNGFSRDGYTFVGWKIPDGTEGLIAPGDEIFLDDEDIYLYAQWKKIVTITFADEDGTVYSVESLLVGDSATPPQAPVKQGYTFAGWTGTYTDVQKDEIVIASWSPNRYDIIYEPNGGEGEHMPVQQTRYDEDETISESSYTRHNYEFVGWNTQPDGTGTSYTPGEVVKNLTDEPDGKVYLYAQWEFYIQMPETGEIGGEALAITGLGMVSVAFASVIISRRQRRDAAGAEASQRCPASSTLWDSCKNHIDSH